MFLHYTATTNTNIIDTNISIFNHLNTSPTYSTLCYLIYLTKLWLKAYSLLTFSAPPPIAKSALLRVL